MKLKYLHIIRHLQMGHGQVVLTAKWAYDQTGFTAAVLYDRDDDIHPLHHSKDSWSLGSYGVCQLGCCILPISLLPPCLGIKFGRH